MPRKPADTLTKKHAKEVTGEPSWAAVGIDTSMSSIAVVGIGYDATLKKMSKVMHATARWNEEHFYKRLYASSMAHQLVLDVLSDMWVVDLEDVHIAIEEPVPIGMIRRMQSNSIIQQCQINGAVQGSLIRYGFFDIAQINNLTWKKVLRQDGVDLSDKNTMKWAVKQWAIDTYGLPDLPDLVQGAHGKTPRPESGRGANAKPIQPDDIYDACAIMEWMRLDLEGRKLA